MWSYNMYKCHRRRGAEESRGYLHDTEREVLFDVGDPFTRHCEGKGQLHYRGKQGKTGDGAELNVSIIFAVP